MLRLGALSAVVAGALLFGAPAGAGDSLNDGPGAVQWTGFYIGAHIGGAWGDQAVSESDPLFPNNNAAPGSGRLDYSGELIGGLHLGYSYSLGQGLVAGIEGDFTWTDLEDSASDLDRDAAGNVVPGEIVWRNSIDWLASVRGRLGVLLTPDVLVYGTGGVAWADVDMSAFHQYNSPNHADLAKGTTKTGFAVGGGVEWALDKSWLIRGEYLHYEFDGDTTRTGITTFPGFTDFTFGDIEIDTVRAAVSYKFGALLN